MWKWVKRGLLVFLGLCAALVAIVFWLGGRGDVPDGAPKNAETGGRILRTAIQQWQAVNNSTACPTLPQLVAEKQLDPGQNTTDSWNSPYQFLCTADEVVVRSAGPDRRFNTLDDIRVPRAAQ